LTVIEPKAHAGTLAIYACESARDLGLAAAHHAAIRIRASLREHSVVPIVFATGASQLETLRALAAIPDLPWNRVIGFHLDEYAGMSSDHPASFRRYLRRELTERVPIREFHFLEGQAPDLEVECTRYEQLLRATPPRLCLLGIGENGHLAFNDPPVARFHDERDVRVVTLDHACRQQQVNEGWFPSLDDVPERAVTMTIPAIMRIPELVLSVPGERKARIVQRTIFEDISPRCPATILRTHNNARMYVDNASMPSIAPA
jgi:glucosamine-6-phosphate deaminase